MQTALGIAWPEGRWRRRQQAVRAAERCLPESERDQVLYAWNDTATEYPADRCVHELFEEQVESTPEAVAVVYGEERLSYGELNGRANQVAHYLRGLGVKPDARVAICVERGFEMIVGLLGVLKAGGAYVPLDPAYPVERLRFMLEDSAAGGSADAEPSGRAIHGAKTAAGPRSRRGCSCGEGNRRAIRIAAASGSVRSTWPMSSTPPAPRARPKASWSSTATW